MYRRSYLLWSPAIIGNRGGRERESERERNKDIGRGKMYGQSFGKGKILIGVRATVVESKESFGRGAAKSRPNGGMLTLLVDDG